MEENKYEGFEPITPNMNNEGAEAPMKEYERLLLAERNRLLGIKAENLIKLGCFEQKQEETFDFDNYLLITEKKYRGLYDLYQNVDTMQLVLVCPLVENNKGDDDERLDLEPYAYDCIYIEIMDDETYNAVLNAGQKNINKTLPVFYVLIKVFYWLTVLITLILCVLNFVDLLKNGSSFSVTITSIYITFGSLIVGCVASAPLVFLMDLKYRDFKNNK